MVEPEFVREFAWAYLKSMETNPKQLDAAIRFLETNENGIYCGTMRDFWWIKRHWEKNKEHFQRLYDLFRHFEHAGRLRGPSDIEDRIVGECGVSLLKAKLGPRWYDMLRAEMRDLHKESQNPFKSGYRSIIDNVKIKLSGKELLVGMNFKGLTYKNATMTMPANMLPESVKATLVGKSLADILGGLPEDECFRSTRATEVESSRKSLVVKFDEPKVLLKAA